MDRARPYRKAFEYALQYGHKRELAQVELERSRRGWRRACLVALAVALAVLSVAVAAGFMGEYVGA